MSRYILHVTDHEYDRILQLNHDALVWDNRDRQLLRRLETLLGKSVVDELRQADECRVVKHSSLTGIPRVEVDATELVSASDSLLGPGF